jgi:hypothetical protein
VFIVSSSLLGGVLLHPYGNSTTLSAWAKEIARLIAEGECPVNSLPLAPAPYERVTMPRTYRTEARYLPRVILRLRGCLRAVTILLVHPGTDHPGAAIRRIG